MLGEGGKIITLYNRQRKVQFGLDWLESLAPLALKMVLEHPRGESHPPLPELQEVEVTFVSDKTIARIHRDFMNIPGATDVITFAHGEIIISTETARENAALYGRSLDEELARYLVHGLLHLNGYEDETKEQADQMHRVQEEILSASIAKNGVE